MVWEHHCLKDLGKQSRTAHKGTRSGRLAPRRAHVAGAGSCPPQGKGDWGAQARTYKRGLLEDWPPEDEATGR